MRLGIIGGSGLYDIDGFNFLREQTVKTEYGEPSDSYRVFEYKGAEFCFLNRHGRYHSVPPHKVNYRANIMGFRHLGYDSIISFTATGGINRSYRPGDIIVPDNGIDLTSGRESTYYDSGDIYHIDFTEPFCGRLRQSVLAAADKGGVFVHNGGTYICTNGPRLETAAEIRAYDRWGADLVGMTLFPECVLAREKEMCYANISVITNFGAGTANQRLTSDEVIIEMGKAAEKLKNIVSELPETYKAEKMCGCGDALCGTKISK